MDNEDDDDFVSEDDAFEFSWPKDKIGNPIHLYSSICFH